MKVEKIDYYLIKTPLLWFVGIIVIASGLIVGEALLLGSNRQIFSDITQTVSLDSETLLKRQEGNELYQSMHEKYLNLLASGLNQGDKLLWMEQLKIQAERLSLPELTYNIKPRQPDAELNATLTDGFSVYTTPIELKLGLLHENQLLHLIDNLQQARLGTFSFEYCELKLNEKNLVFKPAKTNIKAECLIKWFEMVRTEAMEAEMAEGVLP